METSTSTIDYEKIDFYKILNNYRIKNIVGFRSYLIYLWKDLTLRSENGNKGINKIIFAKYYELPGLIQEQLFNIFSSNSNIILGNNFVNNMILLFTKGYEELVSFIFKMYDFDLNGQISKEDIRVLLSYIPLNRPKLLSKNQTDEFGNRIESQEELHNKLDLIFEDKKYINEREFKEIIENKDSDIFLYLIILLFERSPFNKKTLEILENLEKSQNIEPKVYEEKIQLIKSPTHNTIFKPCYGLLPYSKFIEKLCKVKTPNTKKMIISFNKNKIDDENLRNKKRLFTFQIPDNNNEKLKDINQNNNDSNNNNEKEKKINFERKKLKHYSHIIENNLSKSDLENDNNTFEKFSKLNNNDSIDSFISFSNDDFNISSDEEESKKLIQHIPEKIKGNYSGYLYKLINGKKMKKFYSILNYRDIFYYKKPNDLAFVGIDNLSSLNYKLEEPISYKNKVLYSISLISSEKKRILFIESKDEYKEWIKNIEKSIGKYVDIREKYKLQKTIECEKFNLIKKGINKSTGEEIIATIMSKEDMNYLDLKQYQNEIEILKIGNHPYIGTVYEICENTESYYKITKYYKGGDLLSYFQRRNFKLSEKRCAEIIRQISVVIYYLQSFGIIHGDLKPENILMTDDSENANIKILDFFSGQIIGNCDYLGYGIGTIPYASPEFLLKKPINKEIDLWSLGVISYFLLSGILPFENDDIDNCDNDNSNINNNNDDNDLDIQKKVINDNLTFPEKYWKNISFNARDFVESKFFF